MHFIQAMLPWSNFICLQHGLTLPQKQYYLFCFEKGKGENKFSKLTR